jgi:hypothetical protein
MARPRFRQKMVLDGVARVSLLGIRLITLDARVERRDRSRIPSLWRDAPPEVDLVSRRRARWSRPRRGRTTTLLVERHR